MLKKAKGSPEDRAARPGTGGTSKGIPLWVSLLGALPSGCRNEYFPHVMFPRRPSSAHADHGRPQVQSRIRGHP